MHSLSWRAGGGEERGLLARRRRQPFIPSLLFVAAAASLESRSHAVGRSAKKVPRVHLVADTMWNCAAAAALLLLLLALVQGKHHFLSGSLRTYNMFTKMLIVGL